MGTEVVSMEDDVLKVSVPGGKSDGGTKSTAALVLLR